MGKHTTQDAKNVKQFVIDTYTKGFISVNTTNGIITNEYFQFKEIQQIIHYPGTGVEIVYFNGNRRVFYNDLSGESSILFTDLNTTMTSWMNSNLN